MGARFSSTSLQELQMPTHMDSHNIPNEGDQAPAAMAPDGLADIMALYRRVAEHSPLPIAMTAGRAHRLCGANPAFCQLLGAERATLLGQSLVDAMPESDTAGVLALHRRSEAHTSELQSL